MKDKKVFYLKNILNFVKVVEKNDYFGRLMNTLTQNASLKQKKKERNTGNHHGLSRLQMEFNP